MPRHNANVSCVRFDTGRAQFYAVRRRDAVPRDRVQIFLLGRAAVEASLFRYAGVAHFLSLFAFSPFSSSLNTTLCVAETQFPEIACRSSSSCAQLLRRHSFGTRAVPFFSSFAHLFLSLSFSKRVSPLVWEPFPLSSLTFFLSLMPHKRSPLMPHTRQGECGTRTLPIAAAATAAARPNAAQSVGHLEERTQGMSLSPPSSWLSVRPK